jgi:hypothetical protein
VATPVGIGLAASTKDALFRRANSAEFHPNDHNICFGLLNDDLFEGDLFWAAHYQPAHE